MSLCVDIASISCHHVLILRQLCVIMCRYCINYVSSCVDIASITYLPPLVPQDHNGHRFFTEQFKVATVCEYCNDPIPLLEKGEVCQGMEYNACTYCMCIDIHTSVEAEGMVVLICKRY